LGCCVCERNDGLPACGQSGIGSPERLGGRVWRVLKRGHEVLRMGKSLHGRTGLLNGTLRVEEITSERLVGPILPRPNLESERLFRVKDCANLTNSVCNVKGKMKKNSRERLAARATFGMERQKKT